MTSLTLTSDSMRAREMSDRRALRDAVVRGSLLGDWSLRRLSRSLPPSSARTMVDTLGYYVSGAVLRLYEWLLSCLVFIHVVCSPVNSGSCHAVGSTWEGTVNISA